ncbi:hypothetical protein DASC09_041190 [Saccharomycopsis crataegensis]|uniref:Aldehyde dehydrogenase 5, mitochondrial n=1 Tax=Saccharomycopsis crataegensis TaxID=43959 RepID=A0AAV5QQU9_9ASCO|nr:hypothetical protein DASC09_041190 [Saccharomycopsis crataegensis]
MSHPLSVEITMPNGIEYVQPTGLFINGEFVPSISGKTFPVIDPSTEEVITEVYEGFAEDIDIAVNAAEEAFENTDWATCDPIKRTKLLSKLADAIEDNMETLASIETMDNGKTIKLSRSDIQLVADYIRSTAGWCDKIYGTVIDTGSSYFTYTKREPLGVCGQIIPWNFPALMMAWKIAPALATGNTVVIKTAESTPLSALYIAQLAKDVGFPPGVLNVISGFGPTAGAAITLHPKIRKVDFTGSTATGRIIMRNAAESNLKKVTLELGGKSPNIVFDDADIKKAVKNISFGIFYNSGEVCCAGSRVYVQEGVYDEVLEEFKKDAAAVKVGDPFDETVFQGAQTSQMQVDKILDYVKLGQAEGATLVTGGERIEGKGYFIKPTIFSDVDEEMRIVKEEIFGPVVTVTKFSTVDEVVEMANNSEYGLAAGLHTNDINKAIDVSNRLKSGTIWVNTYNSLQYNTPFGGMKQSGFDKDSGKEALDNYTQVKAVRMKIIPSNK